MIQCTDYSNARITKNGDVLDNKPKHLVTPLIVRMTKTTDGDWKFPEHVAEGQGVMRRLIATSVIALSATLLSVVIPGPSPPSLGQPPSRQSVPECACPMRRMHRFQTSHRRATRALLVLRVLEARECVDEGKVIPCSKGGFSWMSAAPGGLLRRDARQHPGG